MTEGKISRHGVASGAFGAVESLVRPVQKVFQRKAV